MSSLYLLSIYFFYICLDIENAAAVVVKIICPSKHNHYVMPISVISCNTMALRATVIMVNLYLDASYIFNSLINYYLLNFKVLFNLRTPSASKVNRKLY